jgi:UrcA family protein
MSFVDRHVSAAVQRIASGLRRASRSLVLLTLCALAPAAFLTGKEGSTLSSSPSAHVWLAGLDLSTAAGRRDARERIAKAARDLCARNLGQGSLEFCVDDVMAAAQRQIEARTAKVSLADLDLGKPQGVQAARERLQAAARRACQEPQNGRDVASTQYSACLDETFAHALRQVDLLQRIAVDF